MAAFFGKHVWWFVVLLVVAGLFFIYSINRPHLHAGGSSNTLQDWTAFLGALAGLIGVIVGAYDRWRGGPSEPKDPPKTSERVSRGVQRGDIGGRVVPDRDDDRLQRGDIGERVVPDRDNDRYEWVETFEFDGYDEDGVKQWIFLESVRRKRGRRFRRVQ